jgi:hypothetical protein
MDESQKKLHQEMTNALRARSKFENRYFKLRTEYEARYGDKVLSAGLEKKIKKKKQTKKAVTKKPIEKKKKAATKKTKKEESKE